MLAARLHGKEDLRPEEIPRPGCDAGEVLLRVKAAAVCGTDVRMFRNGARAATAENPLVLGHEVSGVVEAVGAGAQVLALEAVGVNGRVIFFGGLPEGGSKVELDTNLVHYKQITITGTTRQSLIQFRTTLGLVASGRLVVRDIVTGRASLTDVRASFEQVMQGKGLKNVIEMPA